MSLVYLQSMYSESCFSECGRNKQQALFLLRVSKLASVAPCVPRRATPLWFGPLAGLLLWLLLLTDSETCTQTHPTSPASFPASTCHRASWLSSAYFSLAGTTRVASSVVSILRLLKGLKDSFHLAPRTDT